MPVLNIDQFLAAVDRAVEGRYQSAMARVERLRSTEPDAHPRRLTALLVRRTQSELGAVAAVSGATAAAPGIGTATTLATAAADATWTITRLAELIMAIGIAHGHDAPSMEERKAWVLSTLAIANGATGTLDDLAGNWSRLGGVRLLAQLGPARLDAFNSGLVTRLAGRLMARGAALSASRLAPFGIGAAVGAAGNIAATRLVGRAAADLFTATPLRRRYEDVLDLDGEEVTVEGS